MAKVNPALIERVKGDILGGVLRPNSKLQIRSLSQRYGTAGSPLREVLSRLVPEGLIRFEQNRGFWVAPLSMAELTEITEMRQLIETEGFRRSMELGDDDWEVRVVVSHHRLSQLHRQQRRDTTEYRLDWEARHRAFHLALIDACGNRKLLQVAEQLYDNLARYRPILKVNNLSVDELEEIHNRIFELALKRDAERGVSELRQHLDVNLRQVSQSLEKTPNLFDMPDQDGGDLSDYQNNDR